MLLGSHNNKKLRVVVAMSGGVDSSTVAAMMAEAGHEVIGVTMQLYDQAIDLARKGACCAGQDIYDAKQVADNLGIPHYVLDYESRFKADVIDDFADSYLRGETPIPCVRCNQTVKFRDLVAFANELGADALATGHYVQRIDGKNGPELHRGANPTKDQSYFLFTTTNEQLARLWFPLGHMTKEETRALAVKYGLKVADKPDSQDICFVPDGNYRDLVSKLRPGAIDPGEIVDLEGRVLGKHQGIINYTIGQRRGLGISASEPLYVIRLDPIKKQVIVGPESALVEHSLVVRQVNWLEKHPIGESRPYIVKLRSTHHGAEAVILRDSDNTAKVNLKTGEKAITPGQACVMYHGSRVIGGGWISRD